MTVIPFDPQDQGPNATPGAEEAADPASTRSRAPAREDDASNATPVEPDPGPNATPLPASATPVEAPNATPAAADRNRIGGLWDWPELWSEDRPSLRKVWHYAVYGPWTAQDHNTAARAAGIGYAGFVIALTASAYSLLWVIERPARAAVAGGLLVLLCLSWFI